MNTFFRVSEVILRRGVKNSFQVQGKFQKQVLLNSSVTISLGSNSVRRYHSTMNAIKLDISPKSGLVDSNLDISVTGLEPYKFVTLYSEVSNDGVKFGSVGHYVADVNGNVNTRNDNSVGGNFVGVEPEGLLWSSVPVPLPGLTIRSNHRLLKQDIRQPYDYSLSVIDNHVALEDVATLSKKVLAASTFERWYKGPNISQIPVRHGRLRGSLLIPNGQGPFIPVIDMFGTVGKLLEFRAGLLASHGFATLALPYFGYEDLPSRLREVDLSYFEEAIDFMLSNPRIDGRKGVGVIGVSKGAEIALLMAEYFEKVGAVVSINGSPFVVEQPAVYKGVTRKPVDFSKLDFKYKVASDGALIYRDAFHSVDMAIELWDEHGIKIEKSDAKFLLLAGNCDQATHPMNTMFARERLRQANKDANCEMYIYEGAGHLLEPPFAPLGTRGYNKNLGVYFAYGGNPKMHAIAQEDSWKRIKAFLTRSLGSPSSSKL